ncbi:MAG: SAM-dependent methyltransferase [Parvibaculaceae bacterium]|jgi:SAM-dependent methyltransferase|nr:methyltransferase domain-containing protein [Parvibaculaceae bacterium]
MLLFDRLLVQHHRNRAAQNFEKHDFLIHHIAQEMAERLSAIDRVFPKGLDLGSHQGALVAHPLLKDKVETFFQCDLSPKMVAKAHGPRFAADEERLPVAEESLNLVTSVLSLHWTNDLPGALIQINRSLKPDGLFLGAVLGGATLHELRTSLSEAEVELEGGLSPRVSPMVDLRDAGSLLQRAGFGLPVTDSEPLTVRYKSPFHLMQELRGMGETNAVLDRRKTPLRRKTLLRAVEIYQEKYGLEDGRIPATFEVIYLTGWAPHESQQKPLAPGSARTRLADALKVPEQSAGEKTSQ